MAFFVFVTPLYIIDDKNEEEEEDTKLEPIKENQEEVASSSSDESDHQFPDTHIKIQHSEGSKYAF